MCKITLQGQVPAVSNGLLLYIAYTVNPTTKGIILPLLVAILIEEAELQLL